MLTDSRPLVYVLSSSGSSASGSFCSYQKQHTFALRSKAALRFLLAKLVTVLIVRNKEERLLTQSTERTTQNAERILVHLRAMEQKTVQHWKLHTHSFEVSASTLESTPIALPGKSSLARSSCSSTRPSSSASCYMVPL